MRVVFMGTPEFAVPSLQALIEHHDVVAVFTRQDAVKGRGRRVSPSPVKVHAHQAGIEVLEPLSLRDEHVVGLIEAMSPDAIVVAAFGMILPPRVLDAALLGCINVHGSLLPRWRGAAPVQRAILAGDGETGVCIMRMEEGLDTGPYCRVARVPVEALTAVELTDRLAVLGAEELIVALREIEAGLVTWIEQDDALATYAEKISKTDVALSPTLESSMILRRVRAATGSAPARAIICEKGVIVTEARHVQTTCSRGGVACTPEGVVLGCEVGSVLVTRLRPDGKSEMDAAAWCRGVRLDVDASWGEAS